MGTWIYHITHIDNVASIAAAGLLCDNDVSTLKSGHRNIAFTGIKTERALTPVPCGPGGTLANYVPFYFAPRSPMLFPIFRDNVEGAQGEHGKIVHLALRVEDIAAAGVPFVFTDGHAIMTLSNFYDDVAYLDRIDWEVMTAKYWSSDGTGEMRRKRQAEFLCLQRVPWELVAGIGVHSGVIASRIQSVLAGASYRPPVAVKVDWLLLSPDPPIEFSDHFRIVI